MRKKKERAIEDAWKAAETRKRSLKTFTKSQNRNNEEIIPKRTRNNDNDTISYLTAKYESELNLRKEELTLRREEIETKTIIQQQGQLLSVLFQNQQNQQAATRGHQTSFGCLMNVYMESGLNIDVHWTS